MYGILLPDPKVTYLSSSFHRGILNLHDRVPYERSGTQSMKTIRSVAGDIRRDIIRQTKREALHLEVDVIFDGFEVPDETNIWVQEIQNDNSLYVEFSPNGEDKDFQSLIHKLCQKFGVSFEKRRDWDEQALRYEAKVTLPDERLMRIIVSGVVPASCRVEETKTFLTNEEYEDAKQKALESVKLYRVERKIICAD